MTYFLIGVAVFVLAYGAFIYNRLVSLRQGCNQSFADIDVQLRQRADLIPNLVSTVKGYAAHESSTFQAVTDARKQSLAASDPASAAAADRLMTQALGRLIAVAEAYPALRASENFKALQDELTDVENKIAAARRFYNATVAEYNAGRQQFPAVLFSAAFGFAERENYSVTVDERAKIEQAPTVSF